MKRVAVSFRRILWQESNLKNIYKRNKSASTPLMEVDSKAPEFENEKIEVKSFDEIPAVPSLPLIGVAWAYLPIIGKYNPLKLDESNFKKCKQYGKIVREDLTKFFPIVHLFDVNDIEKLYRNEGKLPNRDPFLSLQYYRKSQKELFTGGGLLASNGKEWYDMRSKVQAHLLKPRSIHSYLHALDGVSLEMVDKIRTLRDDASGEVQDLMPELYKWALESVSLIALETKLNCMKENQSPDSDALQMIKAVNTIFRLWYKLEYNAFKLWRYFPSRIYRKFVKNMTTFSQISYKYIHEAKARMDANRDVEREPTLLETFFYKENMDQRDAATMIADMLLGGIDTTSHSVAFALYHLAKNQQAQEKAYQEVLNIVPDKNTAITHEHLNEARYLKACSKESMRLNPIIGGTVRRLNHDIVMSGYRIPAGVMMVAENMITGRLEENFEDAHKFKPERWLRGVKATEKINKFASLPFSMGTRSCIGRRIAEQEMWTLLIRILQNFKVEYYHEDIGAITRLVNVPDKPLRFKFVER